MYMSRVVRGLASGTRVNIESGSIASVHSLENLVGGAESGNVCPVLLNRNSSNILWYRSVCQVRFEWNQVKLWNPPASMILSAALINIPLYDG